MRQVPRDLSAEVLGVLTDVAKGGLGGMSYV